MYTIITATDKEMKNVTYKHQYNTLIDALADANEAAGYNIMKAIECMYIIILDNYNDVIYRCEC